MIRYEKRKVTYEKDVMIERSCDLCGRTTEDWDNWVNPSNAFEYAETEVTMQEGTRFPSGPNVGYHHKIDICHICFKERLMPWVEQQGGVWRKVDIGD